MGLRCELLVQCLPFVHFLNLCSDCSIRVFWSSYLHLFDFYTSLYLSKMLDNQVSVFVLIQIKFYKLL